MNSIAILRRGSSQLRDFSGLGGDGTYLWPRWIVLRGIGLIYIIIFAGIIVEGRALIGPNGIVPVSAYFVLLKGPFPEYTERLLRAPSLFWLGTGYVSIAVLEWTGIVAAIAVVLNLWPRMALFACWAVLLSFVSAWGVFTSTIDDKLMLETAFLCIPFAPSGLKPGLGADTPPRPIATFAMRWLVVRLMLESGLIKLLRGDSHWHDLSAIKVMFETSPLPTFLGYMNQHSPQIFQCIEIGLTFAAELVAPVLAIFYGRPGRWIALVLWISFQAGIELTTSFGWLNTASIVLGLTFLDDQMLGKWAERLRLENLARVLIGSPRITMRGRRCSFYGLRLFLGIQFCLGIYFFGASCLRKTITGIPSGIHRPVDFIFRDFWSANTYVPYESFPLSKYEVEFQGTNDGGKSWRTFEFRFKPQRPDAICRYVAPWLPRFEAGLQLAVYAHNSPVIARVAALLILRSQDVMSLFKNDPFPDGKVDIVRMPVYRFSFTDFNTFKRSGRYWNKDYVGDFGPPVCRRAD